MSFRNIFKLCLLAVVSAETYYVTPDASAPCPGECHTLSEYANDPPSDSSITLVFLEGMHSLSINFSLSSLSSLVLENDFESTVTISCSNDARFWFKSVDSISIRNISLVDCYGNNITSIVHAELTNSLVHGTQNSSEAVFYLIDIQNFYISGCKFSFITATELPTLSCAILHVRSSSIFVNNTVFDQNTAMSSSGNIGCVLCSQYSSITILDSSFTNNTVLEEGTLSSTLLILDSNLTTIQNSRFISNQALTGGAVYGENSVITVSGSIFAENYANKFGGVAYLSNSVFTLEFCDLRENGCEVNGGVIYSWTKNTIVVFHSEFLYNFALGSDGNAGVLHITTSHAFFTNCSFIGNRANNSGVVSAFTQASLTIDSCIFANNSALSMALGAGGVVNAQDDVVVSITSSTFVQNSAGSGGCANIKNAAVSINSSVFEGNTATYGGAFTTVNSTIHIEGFDNNRVRFEGNFAQHGGALNIIENSVAHIQFAIFEHNAADKQCSDLETLRSYDKNCRGGAILVRTNTTLYLEDTNFTENVVIGKGGAIFAQFSFIKSSGELIVEKNRAENGTLYITSSSVELTGNILFSNNHESLFAHNSKIMFANQSMFQSSYGFSEYFEGGAVTAVSSTLNFWGIVFISNNQAKYGGGIKLTNSALTVESLGTLVLQDNFADTGGALHVYNSPIQIRGRTTFESNIAANEGGAIYLVSSFIQYYSSSRLVSFFNNSAKLGGAIYFDRTSGQSIQKEKAECDHSAFWYCTEEWMQLNFADNSASEKGGALYVDDEGASTCSDSPSEPIYKECFIQTIAVYEKANDWSTTGFNYANINFHNNTAAENQGSLLYGGLLDRCAISEYAELVNDNKIKTEPSLKYFATLTNSSESFSNAEVASGPVLLCFCDYNETLNCTESLHVPTKRGQLFNVTVIAVDQLHTPIETKVIAYLSGNANSHLGEDQTEQYIDATCTDLEFSVFSAHSENLVLYADGPCGDNSISHAVASIEINPSCPVGFTLSNSSLECVHCKKFGVQYPLNVQHTIGVQHPKVCMTHYRCAIHTKIDGV